ncbi:unnamed protein product, partial [Rotaria magnacalcarata]
IKKRTCGNWYECVLIPNELLQVEDLSDPLEVKCSSWNCTDENHFSFGYLTFFNYIFICFCSSLVYNLFVLIVNNPLKIGRKCFLIDHEHNHSRKYLETVLVSSMNNQPSKISNTCSLFVTCFGFCCGELYSIMVLEMVDKWLRIKLGGTYNYLVILYSRIDR